jgi:hypothetical protein
MVHGTAVAVLLLCGQASAQESQVSIMLRNATADGVSVPDLSAVTGAGDKADYWKYFYFHREETDFSTALEDIVECDQYASGISYSTPYASAPYPYAETLIGGVSGALANVMMDAVFGSAERRKQRRLNLRKCMGFKGYSRFGLPSAAWDKFNFEEGNRTVEPVERVVYLRQQAKIASGPRPQQEVLKP